MFSDRGRSLLTLGAVCSAVLAVLHLAVVVIGPAAYRYVGAPDEFAQQTEAGSSAPAIVTALFAVIFAVWAAYALAGARRIARPPVVRLGLVVIAGVYILRGLSAVPEALLLLRDPDAFPPRFLVFSLISLAIGIVHAVGTRQAWRRLRHHHMP